MLNINLKSEENELENEQQRLLVQKDTLLQEILQDILAAKRELLIATQNFNFADNNELIDLYSYQIIVAQSKCDYLLKKAKDNGISYSQFSSSNLQQVNL